MKYALATVLCLLVLAFGLSLAEIVSNQGLNHKLTAATATVSKQAAQIQSDESALAELQTKYDALSTDLARANKIATNLKSEKNSLANKIGDLEAYIEAHDQTNSAADIAKAKKEAADRAFWANYRAATSANQAAYMKAQKEQQAADAAQAIVDERNRKQAAREAADAKIIENDRIRAEAASTAAKAALRSAQNGN